MKTAITIVSGIEILAGLLFVVSIASDIQLGFGLVLIFQGVLFLLNNLR